MKIIAWCWWKPVMYLGTAANLRIFALACCWSRIWSKRILSRRSLRSGTHCTANHTAKRQSPRSCAWTKLGRLRSKNVARPRTHVTASEGDFLPREPQLVLAEALRFGRLSPIDDSRQTIDENARPKCRSLFSRWLRTSTFPSRCVLNDVNYR